MARVLFPISHSKVAQILHDQGYSLQGNRKTEEGIPTGMRSSGTSMPP